MIFRTLCDLQFTPPRHQRSPDGYKVHSTSIFPFPITSLRTNNTDIHSKQVADTRPPGMRANYTDVSSVTKYELPPSEYEKRDDSVLAWKKANKLGRFDPVCIA